jgi:FAD/FMN-containing dehydrogenase
MDENSPPRRCVVNFGGNVRFTPQRLYAPRNESEVLALLDEHRGQKIRVVGSKHSWSDAIRTDQVLLDLRHLKDVATEADEQGRVWAQIGGGCRIKRALELLRLQIGGTLPSVGLITEQTIAGAISTGTHGSGKHSLSHYMSEIRVAAYDPQTGEARVVTYGSGPELLAARCALGCLGVIVSVRLQCVPQYLVSEDITVCPSLDDVRAQEAEYPLQQFYLIPHAWTYYAQRRRAWDEDEASAIRWAALYRVYWFVVLDVGFHLIIKLLAAGLRSGALVRWAYRHLLPRFILKRRTVIDRSDRMLTMEHEMFRHLEIELFVPTRHLARAADLVRHVLEVFAGDDQATLDSVENDLTSVGLLTALESHRGTFTHHYPICFRRILPDDTLISMAAGDATVPEGENEPCYSISLITYVEPREPFFALADFLAAAMTPLYGARLHWGKYFPLGHADIADCYPRLTEFREICRRADPNGVFRNEYVDEVLGFRTDHSPQRNA